MEPVLLLVVANAASRRQLVDELGRYRRDYRIETSADGERAIVRLRALRSTGVPVAMVLADLAVQPGDGVDVLARARAEVPTAKRILLLDWGLHGEQRRDDRRTGDVAGGCRHRAHQALGPAG